MVAIPLCETPLTFHCYAWSMRSEFPHHSAAVPPNFSFENHFERLCRLRISESLLVLLFFYPKRKRSQSLKSHHREIGPDLCTSLLSAPPCWLFIVTSQKISLSSPRLLSAVISPAHCREWRTIIVQSHQCFFLTPHCRAARPDGGTTQTALTLFFFCLTSYPLLFFPSKQTRDL